MREKALSTAVLLACAAGTAAGQPYTVVQWVGYQTTCGDPLPPIAAFTDPDCWSDGIGPMPPASLISFDELVVIGGSGTAMDVPRELYLGDVCASAGPACPPITWSAAGDRTISPVAVLGGTYTIDGGVGVYGDGVACGEAFGGQLTIGELGVGALPRTSPVAVETSPATLELRDARVVSLNIGVIGTSEPEAPSRLLLDNSSFFFELPRFGGGRWTSLEIAEGSSMELVNGSVMDLVPERISPPGVVVSYPGSHVLIDGSMLVASHLITDGAWVISNGSIIETFRDPRLPVLVRDSLVIEGDSRITGGAVRVEPGAELSVRGSELDLTSLFVSGEATFEESSAVVSRAGYQTLFDVPGSIDLFESSLQIKDELRFGGDVTVRSGSSLVARDVVLGGEVVAIGSMRVERDAEFYGNDQIVTGVVADGDIVIEGDRVAADELESGKLTSVVGSECTLTASKAASLSVSGERNTVVASEVVGDATISGAGTEVVDSIIGGSIEVAADDVSCINAMVHSDLRASGERLLFDGGYVGGTFKHSGAGLTLRDAVLENWEISSEIEELSNVTVVGDLTISQSLVLASGEGFSIGGDLSVVTDGVSVTNVVSFIPWDIGGDLLVRASEEGHRVLTTLRDTELTVHGSARITDPFSTLSRLTLRGSSMRTGGDIEVVGGRGLRVAQLDVVDSTVGPRSTVGRDGDAAPVLMVGGDEDGGYLQLRSGVVESPVVISRRGRMDGTGTVSSIESAGEIEMLAGLGPIVVSGGYTQLPTGRIDARGEFKGISASTVKLGGRLDVVTMGEFGAYLVVESRDADIEGDWDSITLPPIAGDRRATLYRSPRRVELVISCVPDTTGPAPAGDNGFGPPDGEVTVSDLSFFIERWIAGDAGMADLTTTGANPGAGEYGVPDGEVEVTDLTYFVELWVLGCEG